MSIPQPTSSSPTVPTLSHSSSSLNFLIPFPYPPCPPSCCHSAQPSPSPGPLKTQPRILTTPWPQPSAPTCTGASSGVNEAPTRGARRLFRPLGPSPRAGLLGSRCAGVLWGGESPSFSGGSFSALPGVGTSVPWLPSSW